jgi:hypothetical protein
MMLCGLQIDAGISMKFVNCIISNTSGAPGQGGADTNALIINPDTGASYTSDIQFVDCDFEDLLDVISRTEARRPQIRMTPSLSEVFATRLRSSVVMLRRLEM